MAIKSVVAFITRLSQRERVIFYATVLVVGLVIVDRMVLSPILFKINALNEAILSKEEAIEQSMMIVTQEGRIEEEISRYAPYLVTPQPEEKETTAFKKSVENIAKKSAVYLTDIKSAGQDVDGVSTRYFVKLSFEAQMEQVINFFYNVSHYEELIKVEGFQIEPKSEGSSVVTCSTSISKAIIPE